MRRRRVFLFLIAVLALSLTEAGLHLIVRRRENVQLLFGRPGYFLVPIDTPTSMPSIARKPGSYRRYDAMLGWTIAENGADPPLYFSDLNGVRVTEAQHAAKFVATRTPRVLAIGDSFTHGDEVRAEDAWPSQLADRLGVTVVNYGVGGYGIDQAILRWRESDVSASIVLLGVIASDLERATTPIYNFERGGTKSKPMFQFDSLSASIANQPAIYGTELKREFQRGEASKFLQLDLSFDPNMFHHTSLDWLFLYRVPRSALAWRAHRLQPIYRTPGPRFEYTMRILQFAKDLAIQRKSRFVVVLLDNNNTFSDRAVVKDPWQLMRTSLRKRGIEFIDTTGEMSPCTNCRTRA